MCGRYSDSRIPKKLRESKFPREVVDLSLFSPRYNLAPTQKASVELVENGKLIEKRMVWGFIPKWSKGPIINAQQETVETKPTFKTALVTQRCLIRADGFYEWKNDGGRKTPMRFVMGDGEPFYFAGIWEKFTKPVKPSDDLFAAEEKQGPTEIETFLILTTNANEVVHSVHTRMPVIVKPDLCDAWIDPESSPVVLSNVLQHPANGDLTYFPVSPLVNSVRNESIQCIASIVQ
jgi:putative SOS response-associated peptidase YedK